MSAINFWAWNMIGPLSTTYAGELSLSSTQASMLVATPILVGALGRIVVGSLTDRFGGRAMFIAVSVVSIVPVLAVGFAGSIGSHRCCCCLGSFSASPARSSRSASRSPTTGTSRRGVVSRPGCSAWAWSARRCRRFHPASSGGSGCFPTHLIVAAALAVTAFLCLVVMRDSPHFTPNTDPVVPKLKTAASSR